MADITFSSRAYGKILLHCAKYPHCSVNGVLLAKESYSPVTGKLKEIDFVDVIPLFHVCLHVSPMAEIALTQIDSWASRQGYIIAGYYTANENLKENSIEKLNHRIADKIAENYSSSCLVVVDNLKLSPHRPSEELPFKVAQLSADGKWKLTEKVSMYPSGVHHAVSSLIRVGAYSSLIDFDNHLDDVTQDWKNYKMNEDIDEVMPLYVE